MDASLTEVTEFRLKLYPKDFVTVRRFYQQHLSFEVLHEWDRSENDKGVMFNVGGTTLEILSLEDGYSPIAGVGLSLAVKDVERLWEKLKNDFNVIHELRNNKWGDTSFCISDPEGLQITFFTKVDA